MAAVTIATGLESRITLNDGVKMPLFGLGVYLASPGQDSEAEKAVTYALQNGYRMIDTAQFYKNEEDVGKGFKKSGLKREDVFIVSKIFSGDGYEHCQEVFKSALKKLDIGYLDLYLIHSPLGQKNCETYKAMLDLQKEGLIKSCGVSNFGVHHLEALEKAGLPRPSVNQIELHPWQRRSDIVDYCQKNGIALMGYSPLVKGQRMDDPILVEIAKRHGKSPAAVLIRYSVQKGFITIPKSVKPNRIVENAQVFDFSLSEEDMKTLDSQPDEISKNSWNPTVSPWNG